MVNFFAIYAINQITLALNAAMPFLCICLQWYVPSRGNANCQMALEGF